MNVSGIVAQCWIYGEAVEAQSKAVNAPRLRRNIDLQAGRKCIWVWIIYSTNHFDIAYTPLIDTLHIIYEMDLYSELVKLIHNCVHTRLCSIDLWSRGFLFLSLLSLR